MFAVIPLQLLLISFPGVKLATASMERISIEIGKSTGLQVARLVTRIFGKRELRKFLVPVRTVIPTVKASRRLVIHHRLVHFERRTTI